MPVVWFEASAKIAFQVLLETKTLPGVSPQVAATAKTFEQEDSTSQLGHMNNPTRYVCPKCGHAMQFWNSLHADHADTPCACQCPNTKCLGMIGRGVNAQTAFTDWQSKNAQETQKAEAARPAEA